MESTSTTITLFVRLDTDEQIRERFYGNSSYYDKYHKDPTISKMMVAMPYLTRTDIIKLYAVLDFNKHENRNVEEKIGWDYNHALQYIETRNSIVRQNQAIDEENLKIEEYNKQQSQNHKAKFRHKKKRLKVPDPIDENRLRQYKDRLTAARIQYMKLLDFDKYKAKTVTTITEKW